MSDASRVASVFVTLPPTKIQSGLSMLNGRNAALLLAVEPLLLEERQQAGDQISVQVVCLRSLVEVEDLVVLAETVAVEVAVGIVEQDALGVEVGERLVALHRLSEGGRVLEREALLAERVAKAHPRAFFAARGAAVAFVDQHEIVALEGIDGDGLVAHLVLELVDVEDLDPLVRRKARVPSFLKSSAAMPGRLELAQVLLAQALVRA